MRSEFLMFLYMYVTLSLDVIGLPQNFDFGLQRPWPALNPPAGV